VRTALIARLRAAGCVFAEDEAAALSLEPDLERRESLVRRRLGGEPLEHLLGSVWFGPLQLAVGPGVFVPRQRSLLLARLAVQRARSRRAAVVLELCCGVAPIAATVAHELAGHLGEAAAELHASDIDPVALAYARRNLPADAGVHEGDLVSALPGHLRGRVHVLAAVAPYVPAGAAHLLPPEAREHEPARALLGGQDGTDLLQDIARHAPGWLAPAGRVLLEMHEEQRRTVVATARGAALCRARWHVDDGRTGVLELWRPPFARG